MRSRLRGLAAIAAVSALIVAGCGDDADGGGTGETEVLSPEETVSQLYAAAGDADYELACSLVSESGAAAIIEDSGDAETCEEAAEITFTADVAEQLAQIEVGEATIDGETATVEISFQENSDTVSLVQEDGAWKVDE